MLDQIRAEKARRATEAQLAAVRRDAEAVRERCRRLRGFLRESWHVLEPGVPFVDNWHIGAISEHLEAVSAGQILRLQINQPPGTMKSGTSSVAWPAHEWTQRPWLRYLTTSYSFQYAERDSRKHRDLVLSEWYQALWPNVNLVRTAADDFENSARGARRATAFETLTGGRGNRVILDDPMSIAESESEADRTKAVFRFREISTSRVNDPRTDAILVIMHRTHPKDVCGIIDELGLDYVKLVLPMEYEPKTVVYSPYFKDPRTEPGELLFPEFFTPQAVARQKAQLTAHAYATQYQQQPTARDGGMFKPHSFGIIEALPAGLGTPEWVRGWDLAGTEARKSKSAAFTAGLLVGRYPNGLYVIAEARRGQLSSGDAELMITNTAAQDRQWVRANGGGTYTIDLPQDPGQAGKAQIRYLVQTLEGYDVRWSPESGSKEVRADPVASQAEIGNVKLLKGQWNTPFLEEAGAFPNGAYKDQIDALSRAFARLVKSQPADIGLVGPRLLRFDE